MARRGKQRTLGARLGRAGLRLAAASVLLSVALVLPWRWLAPPTTAFILRERARDPVAPIHQRWLPPQRISGHLAISVVAAEDQKFPTHHGFDFRSIARAARERPGQPRGASTISQQVAKNLFLWPGRSFVRKGLEAYLTVLIELLWPKQRILEVYLNVAEFAPGIYGAGAASELLIGKPASSLGAHEAALLAAVLPSPQRMSASDPSEYVRGRAREIEALARGLGGVRYLAGL
ncbi:MAG: monofunctional biosynthetic peptidoglycan transglycosylase [Proteobacteria bacterium]|nr:monofunctional biosynthetic peptidoglycan transglycosylase [Pseudomonadota bacterium]